MTNIFADLSYRSEEFVLMVIYLGLVYVFMGRVEWNASIFSQICINIVSRLIFVFKWEFSDSIEQKTLFLRHFHLVYLLSVSCK